MTSKRISGTHVDAVASHSVLGEKAGGVKGREEEEVEIGEAALEELPAGPANSTAGGELLIVEVVEEVDVDDTRGLKVTEDQFHVVEEEGGFKVGIAPLADGIVLLEKGIKREELEVEANVVGNMEDDATVDEEEGGVEEAKK